MKNNWFIKLLCILCIFSFSCNNNNNEEVIDTIYGSWVREITDSEGVTFTGQMTYNQDNTFDFEPITSAPGHTPSSGDFTLTADRITFVNDVDCGTDGAYDYVVGDNSLAIIAVSETCDPRKGVLQSVWRKN